MRAPFGVQVAQVLPSTVSLELEKSATRVVPVKPVIHGEPAAGFVVGRQTAEPATVRVIGPESRVRQLVDATTEPVSIAGSRDRVRDVVTVGVADAAVRLDTPTRATVIVEILPAPVERELAGVPIRWRNLGTGMQARVVPSVAKVSVPAAGRTLSTSSAPTGSKHSWTLPGSVPAGTICAFRSIQPSTSVSMRSRPVSSR